MRKHLAALAAGLGLLMLVVTGAGADELTDG